MWCDHSGLEQSLDQSHSGYNLMLILAFNDHLTSFKSKMGQFPWWSHLCFDLRGWQF